LPLPTVTRHHSAERKQHYQLILAYLWTIAGQYSGSNCTVWMQHGAPIMIFSPKVTNPTSGPPVYHNGNPKTNSKTESFQFLWGMYISDSNRIWLKRKCLPFKLHELSITPNELRHILPNAPQTKFNSYHIIQAQCTSCSVNNISSFSSTSTHIMLLTSTLVTNRHRNMCPCCFSCEFSKTCFV